MDFADPMDPKEKMKESKKICKILGSYLWTEKAGED